MAAPRSSILSRLPAGSRPIAVSTPAQSDATIRRRPSEGSARSASERALEVSRSAKTPADTFGPLYDAVTRAKVFPDNKTFVDLIQIGRASVRERMCTYV